MKRRLFGCLILMLVAVGCTPYARYSKYGPEAAREIQPTQATYTTDDYIRLGLILREYLGKPYRGKSRYQQGLDCSEFTYDVFRKFNRTILPRTVADQYKEGREVRRTQLAYGDLVFFRTERRKVSHVGIYVGHSEFMHATNSRGVIINNLTEKYWAERYVGARRILDKETIKTSR